MPISASYLLSPNTKKMILGLENLVSQMSEHEWYRPKRTLIRPTDLALLIRLCVRSVY